MAYELVSSPSSQEAVMTALKNFAVGNGWVLDNYTAANVGVSRGVMSLHRGNCYVSFRWEGVESESSKSIALYQATGYSAGQAATPWGQPGANGQGTTSTNLSGNGAKVYAFGSGPYISLHLFAFDTDQVTGNSAPTIYCVLEFSPGQYRHFAFGNIDKFGDWVGGEWIGGHYWHPTRKNNPTFQDHTVLLDGKYYNTSSSSSTIRVSGLPGQAAGSKWALVSASRFYTTNDPDGDQYANVQGGCRTSLYTYALGPYFPSALGDFVPLFPCPVFYKRSSHNSGQVYYLGNMANIRMVSIKNYNPGDEITIGTITWKLFPVVRKGEGSEEFSWNMGIAYVKEVS